MEGTKKKEGTGIRIITLLLIVFAVIAISMRERPTATPTKITPEDEGENKQYSFIEGMQLSLIQTEIQVEAHDGRVSENQYRKFENMTSKLLYDFTYRTQKEIYDYASRLLRRNVKFYYHEDADIGIYMEGYAVQSLMLVIDLYHGYGYISDKNYKEIEDIYEALIEQYSDELFKEFLHISGEIMSEAASTGEPVVPPSKLYIRII